MKNTKLHAMALLLAAGMATGCANYSKSHYTVGSVPDDYRTRHPIVVSQDQKTHDLMVPEGSASLSTRNRTIVHSVARAFHTAGARTLTMALPTGSPNEAATTRVARHVAREFARFGIGRNRIEVTTYDASQYGVSAPLRLSYADMKAEVASQCGKWDENLLNTHANKNYGNFGCATQNNLAQMIVNPGDLITPHGSAPIDAERRANAISDWQKDGSGFF